MAVPQDSVSMRRMLRRIRTTESDAILSDHRELEEEWKILGLRFA